MLVSCILTFFQVAEGRDQGWVNVTGEPCSCGQFKDAQGHLKRMAGLMRGTELLLDFVPFFPLFLITFPVNMVDLVYTSLSKEHGRIPVTVLLLTAGGPYHSPVLLERKQHNSSQLKQKQKDQVSSPPTGSFVFCFLQKMDSHFL